MKGVMIEPSPTFLAELDTLRAYVREQLGEQTTTCYVQLTEHEAADLASGFVPTSVVAKCRLMLDENSGDRDEQRAQRPKRAAKARHGA